MLLFPLGVEYPHDATIERTHHADPLHRVGVADTVR
jgi:hypothetical protein